MSDITIYHNPACGTSRNVLGLIRNSGVEPTVIHYLETPPDRAQLERLIADLGMDDETLSDDVIVDAMMAHPVLINRPIVVTPRATRLCRPSEAVLDILPGPQRGAFAKEDGEAVIDAEGRRVARS